jgi:hypothetical protein
MTVMTVAVEERGGGDEGVNGGGKEGRRRG